MRKILLGIAIITFLFYGLAEAKRGPAPEVQPITHKGIKFIAPNTPQTMGYVEGWDIKSNTKIWEKEVYSVFINPIMEADVQWVFITSLTIEDERLVVVDERGKEYKIDIPTNILKEDYQPLQLTIKPDKQVYEVEEKKGISKEEALGIAEEVCKKEGWEWKDVGIVDNNDKWHIVAYSGRLGNNAEIDIDKNTGEVLNKFYNPE